MNGTMTFSPTRTHVVVVIRPPRNAPSRLIALSSIPTVTAMGTVRPSVLRRMHRRAASPHVRQLPTPGSLGMTAFTAHSPAHRTIAA
jgi:hypothetical protein